MSYKIEIREDLSEDRLAFSVIQNGIRIALFQEIEDAKLFIHARCQVEQDDIENNIAGDPTENIKTNVLDL
ncbi:MAG: hypothetical protein JNM39_09780 [Bdellovibrionaceae bacterium]|nr:hypothetical protein [Pseudobdellovibrionaceae bacterium]